MGYFFSIKYPQINFWFNLRIKDIHKNSIKKAASTDAALRI